MIKMSKNVIDITGKDFKYFTVVNFSHVDKTGRSIWLCKCHCKDHTEVLLCKSVIKSGNVKYCPSCHPKKSITFKDRTGDRFGRLQVIKIAYERGYTVYWECLCDCGNKTVVCISNLRTGHTKSCGCLSSELAHERSFIDLTGKIFNRLTVIKFSGIKNRQTYWECLCNCGNTTFVCTGNLGNGHVQSCGCLHKERTGDASRTHGLTGTRPYRIWRNMLTRCTNPAYTEFYLYGGRGIKVCEEWFTFEQFWKDNGESYLKHVAEFGEDDTSIDRWPNVNGNYEPSNIRWATRSEQARGKRISAKTVDYNQHDFWKRRLLKVLAEVISGRTQNSKLLDEYTGISSAELRKHIESQFEPWMNWDNYGKGIGKWCIDHIIPCNRFDLSTEQGRKDCFNSKNLRPYNEPQNTRESCRISISV